MTGRIVGRSDVGRREQRSDPVVGRIGDRSLIERLRPQGRKPLLLVSQQLSVDRHSLGLSSSATG